MQLHTRMASRDPAEANRASTPLELFYDLTFVVAIAQLSASLHHGLVEGDLGHAVLGYLFVFFAIWWAWTNFTWFASAYDTDDVLYRLAVFVQMTGVLILAAGVPRAFDDHDFGLIAAGYVVMRLALVAQWVRAGASHPGGRQCARRYAAGVTVVQVGWLAWLTLPEGFFLPVGLVLVAAELAVPLWAESAGRTSWHPRHIAERHGLFTIIVLGESILAAATGVQHAVDADGHFGDVVPVVVGGLLIVFALWSVYFDLPVERAVERVRLAFAERITGAFAWGYGHYIAFAGAAATGAGIAVAVDQATGTTHLSDLQAGLAVTLPVSAYLLAVWAVFFRLKPPGPLRAYAVPVAVVLILAASATPQPVLVSGLILAALVGAGMMANIARQFRSTAGADPPA